MDLNNIAEKISKNWKGLPNGLKYKINYKHSIIFFAWLSGEDVVELNDFAKKHNKRIEIYHSNHTGVGIEVYFKNAL